MLLHAFRAFAADLVADLIIFFEGKEANQFGHWWQNLSPLKRAGMLEKAKDLLHMDSLLMSFLDQAGKEGETV